MLFVEERVRGSLVGNDFAAVSSEFGAHSFKLTRWEVLPANYNDDETFSTLNLYTFTSFEV